VFRKAISCLSYIIISYIVLLYSQITQGHQASSHDRGASQNFGYGGGSVGAYDQHASGMNNLASNMAAGSSMAHLG
jgi:hypothetical protein